MGASNALSHSDYLDNTVNPSHLSFNHLSALATAWQICSLHEVSLDVKPFTKFANDISFEV